MPRAESWPENLGAVPSLTFARPARVLVALEQGDRRELLTEGLEDEGYEVETASTGLELKGRLAGSVLAGEPFDLLVLGLDAPGLGALEVPTVVVDGSASPEDIRDCAVTLVSPVKANERSRAD